MKNKKDHPVFMLTNLKKEDNGEEMDDIQEYMRMFLVSCSGRMDFIIVDLC